MKIKELAKRLDIEQNKKLTAKYVQFEKLINELRIREIPNEIVNSINIDIDQINSISGSNKELSKQLRKIQSRILTLIEKELKLVTKNHYRRTWMVMGMAAFGIPLGVAFGVSIGNMAFLGIGIPIGMAVGIAIGTAKDKEAYTNGNQLDTEIKY